MSYRTRGWMRSVGSTVTQASAILSALALFPSIYFASAAVNEATAQRRASYEPHLAFPAVFVELNVRCSPTVNHEQISFRTSYDAQNWRAGPFRFRVANLGKGAARDVGYTWNFGTRKTAEYLSSLGIKLADGGSVISYDERLIPELPVSLAANDSFVLPTEQSSPAEIDPESFVWTQLILQTAIAVNHEGCEKYSSPLLLNGATLSVQFYDIEGQRFNHQFETRYFPYAPVEKKIDNRNRGMIKVKYKVVLAPIDSII